MTSQHHNQATGTLSKLKQHKAVQAVANLGSKISKNPIWLVGVFAVVGIATIILSLAFSVPTKGVTINLSSCSGAVRCSAGASASSNAIGFNGAPVTNTATACKPGVTNTRFNIVGGQIIDPNCKVFLPMGANIAVSPGYTFNWKGVANGHVADVKAWGWNTIRLTQVCASANGTNDMNALYAGIDSVIEEYTKQNVVVMLECHDFTGKNPTDVSSLYPFWDRMTTKWGSNAYVWFNPVNEPYQNEGPTDIANWMNLQTTLLNRVRAKAPYNIFVADIPGYGQGTNSFKGTDSITRLGAGKCNVMYAWHDYGSIGDYNTSNNEASNTAAQIAMFDYIKNNKIPVVIGELGDPLTLNEGTAGPPVWNRWGAYAAMANAPQRGIGLLWWHATGDSGIWLTYSLMADRNVPYTSAQPSGSGLSAGGQKFWQVSHSQPAPATFTGDLAASNCK